MAAKITNLDDPNFSPHLKKNVALVLVRRGQHEWQVFGVSICRRKDFGKVAHCREVHAQKLPPREIPNCYFEEPKSVTWRLQHRMVRLAKATFPQPL